MNQQTPVNPPMNPWLLIILTVYCAAGLALVTNCRADAVDEIAKAELRQQSIPGLSIAVVRDGKVIKAEGYGFANVEHRVPASADTIYQSGSVGKQFTAALVMLLVQDGKLALDGAIHDYLPDASKAWKKVTIRHLLTHTSGLDDPYKKLNFRHDYTEAELLGVEGEIPVLFEPGEKFAYSNTGYHVLGFACGRVGGKFYGDQLRERIFEPLKMQTARVVTESDIVTNRAAGYELVKGQLKNQSWVAPALNTTADGSLYLTVRDLAKWDMGLDTDVPLSPSQKAQLWTPARLNDGRTHPYGFAWQIDTIKGRKVVQHGGAWQGFTSYFRRHVDDRLTVIVLTNLAWANPARIAEAIADVYLAGGRNLN